MNNWLKPIRVIFALPFLILFAFIFIDFTASTPHWAAELLTRIQFVPGFLFLLGGISIAAVLFFFVVALSLLFGRVYCSFLCPLGIMQDVISRIAKPFKKKKINRFSKAHNILRYTLLTIVIASILIGSSFLLNLLDPYSNFGKIWADLIRPIYISGNNLLAATFEKLNVYFFYPVDIKHLKWVLYIYPLIFLVTVTIMSALKGRLFCNTLCPVGSTLGLISAISVFKIKIKPETCTKCGKCSTVCKSSCIDIKNMHVDFTRCVGCFNCLKACNDNSIGYSPIQKRKTENPENIGESRRNFFAKTGLLLIGGSLLSKGVIGHSSKKKSIIANDKNSPITPPGSISIDNFNRRCTACHLCVSNCPTHVLRPSTSEYGITGLMQPHMDYNESFCNFECTKCSEVCPTGAIMPLTKENKITTQIGQVRFIKENCIVYLNETSCGACSEHCPTKAVYMVPYKGFITIPEVNVDICVGCGGCEYICPARPNKAIFVDGSKTHKVAQKPTIEKNKEEELKEFPF